MDLQPWATTRVSRLAHLLLEVYTRLKVIDPAIKTSFRFPATQAILGEAIGMSAVHVNRILRELKADGLLQFSHGKVTILDELKLLKLADFDPLYLHPNPEL
ncbi:MAG: winged helix-turn-helix domain-containing protein [Bradyrhizobium sp.]|uniref:Crp/Fnr family transcriptional regulator n=1 Tax=Bradyrhizobium sp. TaxID=376 RepID=UPI002382CD09|nr:helix-turn-helix domain-containing protein [Bradyrhizobium sp.]MDE2471678.1 winged helix-turn-helix domain-containing protein [Bradyrhizobium sp.]